MKPSYTKQRKTATKFASEFDISRIEFAIIERRNNKLDNKSNMLLSCFVALSKLGNNGISSPIYHILKMLNRNGYNISQRSIFRALSQLQSLGYITRQKYRTGDDRFRTIIRFADDAFSYWTQKRTSKIAPIPTRNDTSYNDSQLPNWQEEDLTNTNYRVNSCNYNNKYTKQRASARDQIYFSKNDQKQPQSKRKKRNSVLTSILICLDKIRELHRSDRKRALSTARCEIHAIDAGVQIIGGSGIDWKYWMSRWDNFSIPVREMTAKNEIIPLLLSRKLKPNSAKSYNLESYKTKNRHNVCQCAKNNDLHHQFDVDVSDKKLNEIRKFLEKGISIPLEISDSKIDYPDIDYTDPDMAMLAEVSKKVKSRVV